MSLKKDFNSILDKTKPHIQKIVTTSAQGYLFGCMVGLFTNKTPSSSHHDSTFSHLASINRTGFTFASVGGIYSLSEALCEKIRGRSDTLNSIIGGGVAGSLVGLCVNKKEDGGYNVWGAVRSGMGFAMYSGVVEKYTNEDKENK